MPGPPIARAEGVVWRVASDRVLVRRAGIRGPAAARELLGAAAVVFAALDGPASVPELAASLRVDEPAVRMAVDALREAGLVAPVGP